MADESDRGGRVSGGPRAEARPLAWHEMTEDQRKATREILDLVDAMAKEPWAGKKKEEDPEQQAFDLLLPHVDSARSSRVVLIEGDRGTGKTAVLVSILKHWSDALRGNHKSAVDPEVADKAKIEKTLGRVFDHARVVPLDVLDLQPLPRSTHLLAHFAARLHRIVKYIEGCARHEREDERPAWQSSARRSTSQEAWRDFQRSVAVGWDDSLKARSSSLDLESYVDELQQTESDRADVRGAFGRLMDHLASDVAKVRGWPKGQLPLFVLPIDDADMNAWRVAELIESLRMLWHPRLAFVVTGHSELFETVLQQSVLIDLKFPGHREVVRLMGPSG